MRRAQCVAVMCGAWMVASCSAVKVQVNGEEMTLNEALGGIEGGGQTHQMVFDADTRVTTSTMSMPLSTAIKPLSELGYDCESSGALLMDPPIAEFTVEHAQRISFKLTESQRDMGWVVVSSDGTYLCGERDGQGLNREFEPGVYKVHAAWSSGSVDRLKASARQPDRPVMSLFLKTYGVDGASEELVIDAQTQNPYYTNGASYRGGFVKPGEIGFGSTCGKLGLVSAQPVMEIVVEGKTPALEVVGGAQLAWATVSEADGDVQCGAPKIEKAGRYKIHALTASQEILADETFMFSPVLWDQTREVTLTGEVPRFRIGSFEKPVVIEGITRPEAMTSTKACIGQGARVGLEPDFFLEFERPTKEVRVMLIPEEQGEQELVVEDITTTPLLMRAERTCARAMQPERFARTRYSLGTADGTYAGFVAHPGGPRDFVAIVWAAETALDPWLTVRDIPQETTTLDERVFTRYYPLYHDAKLDEMEAWRRVPESLHMYVKERAVASKSSSQSAKAHTRGGDPLEVRPGEAVLLVEVLDRRKAGQPGKVRVFTSDGWDMVIDGYTLTTEHPDTWR